MQLWPVGFEAESGGHTGCTLRSSIIDGGSKGPMFTVALLPTDAGQEPAVRNSPSSLFENPLQLPVTVLSALCSIQAWNSIFFIHMPSHADLQAYTTNTNVPAIRGGSACVMSSYYE